MALILVTWLAFMLGYPVIGWIGVIWFVVKFGGVCVKVGREIDK